MSIDTHAWQLRSFSQFPIQTVHKLGGMGPLGNHSTSGQLDMQEFPTFGKEFPSNQVMTSTCHSHEQ